MPTPRPGLEPSRGRRGKRTTPSPRLDADADRVPAFLTRRQDPRAPMMWLRTAGAFTVRGRSTSHARGVPPPAGCDSDLQPRFERARASGTRSVLCRGSGRRCIAACHRSSVTGKLPLPRQAYGEPRGRCASCTRSARPMQESAVVELRQQNYCQSQRSCRVKSARSGFSQAHTLLYRAGVPPPLLSSLFLLLKRVAHHRDRGPPASASLASPLNVSPVARHYGQGVEMSEHGPPALLCALIGARRLAGSRTSRARDSAIDRSRHGGHVAIAYRRTYAAARVFSFHFLYRLRRCCVRRLTAASQSGHRGPGLLHRSAYKTSILSCDPGETTCAAKVESLRRNHTTLTEKDLTVTGPWECVSSRSSRPGSRVLDPVDPGVSRCFRHAQRLPQVLSRTRRGNYEQIYIALGRSSRSARRESCIR